jgi:NTP pyrophosphatase (non-canonical NTP hydrolase)
MRLDDYQHEADRTRNRALSPRDRALDAAAGLAEEAGEVLGLIRKNQMQGKALDLDALRLELGDVLWCLAAVAHDHGLSLDQVAAANLDKLRARHPDGFPAP